MAMLWAAWRLSVHQIRLPGPRFPDRKVETAGCPEIGDLPWLHLLDLEYSGKHSTNHFFAGLKHYIGSLDG